MKTSPLVAGICGCVMSVWRGASSNLRALGVVAAFLLTAPQLHATNYYWDLNGATAGSGLNPNGTWASGASTTWSTDPLGATALGTVTTASTDDLFFVAGPASPNTGGGYTVTMTNTQFAHSLNFQDSGATTFGGTGQINLYGGGINIPLFATGATKQGQVSFSSGVTLNVEAPQTWTDQSTVALTIAGPITNTGGGGVTIKGQGIINLTNNASSNAPGTLNIGDAEASGSLAGNLTVGTQNELGSGAVNVNYGGFLNLGLSGTPFSSSNNITVNTGGFLYVTGNADVSTTTGSPAVYGTVPGGLLTLSNLATVGWLDTNLTAASYYTYTVGSTVTGLPTAGAITFDTGGAGNFGLGIVMNGAYGALSGTLAIGGSGTPGDTAGYAGKVEFTTASNLSTVANSARTIAFNTQGDRSAANVIPFQLGGIILNAPLTVKGSGNAGVMGTIDPDGFSETGLLTSTGGNQSLTIAMSPVGGVAVPYTGNTGVSSVTVNSGWLGIDGGGFTNTGKVFTNSTTGITLNGGGLAVFAGGVPLGGGTNITDAIVIGTKGGSLDSDGTGGSSGVVSGGGTLAPTSNTSPLTQTVNFSGNITNSAGGGGPLNLISGRQADGNGGLQYGAILVLSGNNSGYTGNITLVNGGGWGGVEFSGANSSGSSNSIFAPNGTMFGFDSLSTASTLMSKFTYSSGQNDAVFAPNTTSGNLGVLNLSNTGTSPLNFSGQIGVDLALLNGGTENVTGAITPFNSTVGYRFATSGNAVVLNFNTANVLTGSNPVDFSNLVNGPGQVNAAAPSAAVNINTSQSFTGALTMNGVGTAALAFNSEEFQVDSGSATADNGLDNFLTIGTNTTNSTVGDLPNATSITLYEGSKLVLNGAIVSGSAGKITSTAGGSGLPVTIEGGSVLQIGDTTAANNNGLTNRLGGSTAAVTLGGANGGGQLNIGYAAATGTSETFASLAVGTGASAIDVFNTPASTLGIIISSGTITHSTGGTLYLPFPTSANFPGITLTGATATTGGVAVNGWMYIPTTTGNVTAANFATVSTTVSGFSGTPLLIADTAGTNSLAANTDWVNTASGAAVSGSLTLNTLNFNTSGTNNLTINTSGTLTLTTGGILNNETGLSILATGTLNSTLGKLTSATNELIVNNAANGNLTIAAQIVQNAGANINLTKLGGGLPTSTTPSVNTETTTALNLTSGNNALGNVWISGGTVEVSTAVASLGSGALHANTVTLEGGGLDFNLAGTQSSPNVFNQDIVVMPHGTYSSKQGTTELNSITNNNAGEFTTLAGSVALNGTLQISDVGTGSGVNFTGNITGAGALVDGYASGANVETLTLSGNNANFSGGIAILQTSRVRLDSTTTPAGTGQITVIPRTSQTGNQSNPELYLGNGLSGTGSGAGGINLANDIINVPTLVDWNTGSGLAAGGTVETFSGKIYDGNGLTFQGSSTGTGATSEIVLAGAVSVDGFAQVYNFSSTPTTTIQNFVNGQGGINLGVTDFQGNTLLNDTVASALPVDASATPGNLVANGARGFVTFGGANSFLPGSVGPGYIAAIAVAGGGGTDEFGYLLSGTSSNGGSTYTMPEGKSFLIGSLGAGTQVSGILGVTGGSATLLGGPKAAAGQTMTGFAGGDIDIQANGPTDNQSLELLARTTTDTLTLGGAGNTVVFTPTYGDSGASGSTASSTGGAITLMSERTGTTTLNKIGTGTIVMQNVAFTNTDGTDASSHFGINVQAGTLVANGTVSPTIAVANAATLAGTGSTGAVTVAGGGTINLKDAAIDSLTVAALTTGGGTASTLALDIKTLAGSTTVDSIIDSGNLTLNSSTTINIGNLAGTSTLVNGTYTLVAVSGTLSGSLSNLSLAGTALSDLINQSATLVQVGQSIDLRIASTVSNGQYTLATTVTGTSIVHANGGTTTLGTTIHNTGTTPQDTLNYSALTATASSGTVGSASGNTSGTALAQGATSSPTASQTYTSGATAGTVTVGNSATVTNTNDTGETPVATNSGSTISVYSGTSTWNTNGSGSWGTLSSGFGTNWGANQGSPGLDSGFTNTDTATFGSAATSGTATVSLNGASPSLNAITFNDSSASYVIAQGSSGSISLKGNGGDATVTDTAGTHTISAPVSLTTSTDVNVASGQKLTFSGAISGGGTLKTMTGSGTTVLSNATGNSYTGGTTIGAGKLFVTNTSNSGTGTGSVTVNSGGTLAGNGFIKPGSGASSGVTVNSGGTIYSGGVVSGTPTVGPGTGLTLDNTVAQFGTSNSKSILAVNGDAAANLTFALGGGNIGLASNPSGGAYNYANPDVDTTFINVVGNTAGEINFAGVDSVSLVDLTSGSLTLRQATPFLLIQTGTGTAFSGLDSNFSGLVTSSTDNINNLQLDGNGFVMGVYNGSGDFSNFTAIAINQYGPDGTTLLPSNEIYPGAQLYLYNGDLEVVPEPGTWALMLGGLALLVLIQRRRKI